MGYLKKRGRKAKDGPRTPSGRLSRAKPAEDAARVVKFARIRQLGPAWFATHKVKPEDPMCGCAVGVAIIEAHAEPDTRADLWNAAHHIRACHARWSGTQGMPSRHAKVARILAPVDALTADPDMPPPDLRTPAEKAASAEAAWWNVRNRLFLFGEKTRKEVDRVVVDGDALNAKWDMVLPVLRDVADWLSGRARA